MNYAFRVTVTDVFERKAKRHLSGAGETATFETYSAGWYLQLDKQISVFVGLTKPEIEVGEVITMILQRSQNAHPDRQ